jgi:hypothetical protein
LILLLASFAQPVNAAPSAEPVINRVYITDVWEGGFTVSWTTDINANGMVRYGETQPPATTVHDMNGVTTHYVPISGLLSGHTYFVEVQSNGAISNNNGAYYQVTLPSALSPCTPTKVVDGTVKQSNGTGLGNAIVYLQLQDLDGTGNGSSQWVTARTSAVAPLGYWTASLDCIRSADLSAYFSFTDGQDQLRLVAQGGSFGAIGERDNPYTLLIPTTWPATIPDFVLDDQPTVVSLQSTSAHATSNQAGLPGIAVSAVLLVSLLITWRIGRKRI